MFLGLCTRPKEMTHIWGRHGPTTNVYIAKMTVPACPPHCCSPIRCHGPPPQPIGVLPPSCTHKEPHHGHIQIPCTCIRHTKRSVWTFDSLLRPEGGSISSHSIQSTVTKQTKTPGFFCFHLFILCIRNVKIFVLCWCVHIAYVSIWCPVDIVVLNLDFTDLCGFYITCRVGEKRGGAESFVF